MAESNTITMNIQANTKAFKDSIAELPKEARIQAQKTYNALQASQIKAEKQLSKLQKSMRKESKSTGNVLEGLKRISEGVGGSIGGMAGQVEAFSVGLSSLGAAGAAGVAIAGIAGVGLAAVGAVAGMYALGNAILGAHERLTEMGLAEMITPEQDAAVKGFQDSLTGLRVAFDTVLMTIGPKLLPVLEDMTNAISGIVLKIPDAIAAFGNMRDNIAGLWDKLVAGLDSLGWFGELIKKAASAWWELQKAITGTIPSVKMYKKAGELLSEAADEGEKFSNTVKKTQENTEKAKEAEEGRNAAIQEMIRLQAELARAMETEANAILSERDKIEKWYLDRLKLIEASGVKGEKAAEARAHAEAEYQRQLGELSKKEIKQREDVFSQLSALAEQGAIQQEEQSKTLGDLLAEEEARYNEVAAAIWKTVEAQEGTENFDEILAEANKALEQQTELHRKNTAAIYEEWVAQQKQEKIEKTLSAINQSLTTSAQGWSMVAESASGATANMANLAASLTDTVGPAIEDVGLQLNNALAEGFNKENMLGMASAAAEAMASISGAIGEYYAEQQAMAQENIEELTGMLEENQSKQEEWREILRAWEQGDHDTRMRYSREEIQSEIKQLEQREKFLKMKRQREREEAKKAWEAQKAAAVAGVAMNTAVAVTNALGSAPSPANFILAGVVGAMGAVQAGIVASQKPPKFHSGGIIRRDRDEVNITARAGEAILNQRAAENLGSEGVDALNNGQMMQPIIFVQIGDEEIKQVYAEYINSAQGKKQIRNIIGKSAGRR